MCKHRRRSSPLKVVTTRGLLPNELSLTLSVLRLLPLQLPNHLQLTQLLLSPENVAEIVNVITPSEAACLDLQDGDFSRESLLTLIISAKESFFKATFPAVGRYFGFEAIEFSGINVQEQTLSFDVIETLSPALHLGHRVVLRFGYLDPTTVMTSFTWRRNPLDNR